MFEQQLIYFYKKQFLFVPTIDNQEEMRHQGIEASNALDEYIKQLEHIQSGRISLVLDKEGKNKINILNELADEEIYIKDIPSWEKIYGELRLIANTVKHAEGNSAGKLKTNILKFLFIRFFATTPFMRTISQKLIYL